MEDGCFVDEKTICPHCKIVYPSIFDVQVYIMGSAPSEAEGVFQTDGRTRQFVVGGQGSEFDTGGTPYSEWLVISEDVEAINYNICAPCVRGFIDEGKIVNQQCPQSCYKCEKKYKNYK